MATHPSPRTTLRALVPALLVLGSAWAPTGAAPSSSSLQSRPDKVVRMGSRGRTSDVSGVIEENTLEGIKIKTRSNTQTIDAEDVISIRWGDVPTSFADGRSFLERADYENAVSRLREAAGDAAAREVVQAAARLMSAEALMAWGRIDGERFAEVVEECDTFLADYEDNRETPRAEWLKARATRLTGDATGAAALFQALHEKGANAPATAGYSRQMCMNAGLEGAHCLVQAGSVAEARTLYQTLGTQFASLIADSAEATADVQQAIVAAQGEAACGEGFCLLAEGKATEAETFFQGRMDTPSEAAAAALGLAEAQLAQGKLREAQIGFARVSASDFRSRDRQARALVGLAEATSQLGDQDAGTLAAKYLEDLQQRYGDTPAARMQASK